MGFPGSIADLPHARQTPYPLYLLSLKAPCPAFLEHKLCVAGKWFPYLVPHALAIRGALSKPSQKKEPMIIYRREKLACGKGK